MTEFTSRIIKGGALLDDTRRLIEVWDLDLRPDENVSRIEEHNLLGKPSRKRSSDLLDQTLRRRFVDPGPQVMGALRVLLDDPAAFRNACYYETSRADALLSAFAEGPLFEWYQQGHSLIPLEAASQWLKTLSGSGQAPDWNEQVRTRIAHGLLSTLRDFQIIEGGAKKQFRTPNIPLKGFAYVAFREHEQGRSSRAIFESTVWRRWLLDRVRVEDLFLQAARLGVLRFQKAGSSIRIDWLVRDLGEVAGAAA